MLCPRLKKVTIGISTGDQGMMADCVLGETIQFVNVAKNEFTWIFSGGHRTDTVF